MTSENESGITRETLIDLCKNAVVNVEHWWNRDTPGAQLGIGKARVLLEAGCKWRLAASPKSDKNTWWIEIEFPGFNAFEMGRSDREYWESELFYIPTIERLMARKGGDWY